MGRGTPKGLWLTACLGVVAFVYNGCVLETSGLSPVGTSSGVGGSASSSATLMTSSSGSMPTSSTSAGGGGMGGATSSSTGGMGGGGGMPFAPDQIGGCLLWFRADTSDVATDANDDIDTWTNRCSGPNATQPNTATRPKFVAGGGVNGADGVVFTRTEFDHLRLEGFSDASNDYTVMVVLDQGGLNQTGTQVIIGADATPSLSRMISLVHSNGAAAGIRDGDTFRDCLTPAAIPQWLTWELDATSAKVRCRRSNGDSGQDDWNGTWQWTGTPLLGSFKAGSFFIDAAVSEVILYNQVISASERAQLEAYATMRYGL